MDPLMLLAGFGGGVIGAYMGALPAFIMTGMVCLVGAIASAAGAPADIAVGTLAFGSFLGPHTAFAGGVAAAAYAGKKGYIDNGSDILTSLNGTGKPDVILMGGIFGLLGAVIFAILGMVPVFGTKPLTDLPGTTVFILALVCRFAFGKSGLTGVWKDGQKHECFGTGSAFAYNVLLGLGLGAAITFTCAVIYQTGMADGVAAADNVALQQMPFIAFGFTAVTLAFTEMGKATPATHHIALIGSYGTVLGLAAFGLAGGIVSGLVCAVVASLVGDFVGRTFNTNVDSHIDPPATTIWILATIVHFIFMGLGVY